MKVGDYVRTNNGGVGKIIKCPFKSMYLDEIWGDIENTETIITNNVYKSSPNIIDLIEYGDIVKYKIDDEEFISEVWGEKNNYFVQNFDVPIDLKDLNITSIVTKEQFESMEYKVGVDKE